MEEDEPRRKEEERKRKEEEQRVRKEKKREKRKGVDMMRKRGLQMEMEVTLCLDGSNKAKPNRAKPGLINGSEAFTFAKPSHAQHSQSLTMLSQAKP